ncbi:hypothetical protein AGMMS49938_17660 [Fibrobacterales bacterium]|nr:hypothetical protein AGMMS49938_17660 [Fibrobacterales bacterium]
MPPNAVIITLKEYEELSSLDGTGSKGDPTISFSIKTFTNGTPLATSASKILLNRNDIDYWSGSISDTISINPATDSLIISPKVLEKDALFDDDISPSGGYIRSPFIGDNGTTLQSYRTYKDIVSKNSLCSITYDLKFIHK